MPVDPFVKTTLNPDLENENKQLKEQLKKKENEISRLKKELIAKTEDFQKASSAAIDTEKQTSASNDDEMAILKALLLEKLAEIEQFIQPIDEPTRSKRNTLFEVSNRLDDKIEMEDGKVKIPPVSSANIYQKLYSDAEQKLRNANAKAEKLAYDYKILLEKNQRSFSPSDLSAYLSKAVDSFNSADNENQTGVNYIINGMDVEMKTMLGMSEGKMELTLPSKTTDDNAALSTIKFSIRPIPKELKK